MESIDLAPARDKPAAIAGAISGFVPFVIHSSTSSSVTVNGVVESAGYRDNVALGAGVLALACGLIALLFAVKGKAPPARLGLAIAVIALGAYQIARGIGAI